MKTSNARTTDRVGFGAAAGAAAFGETKPLREIRRGFDDFLGLPMSHDYGCTDRPGYDISCPHRAADENNYSIQSRIPRLVTSKWPRAHFIRR